MRNFDKEMFIQFLANSQFYIHIYLYKYFTQRKLQIFLLRIKALNKEHLIKFNKIDILFVTARIL